ncbi:hypothetical protein AVEN_273303-1 [Araneus ventricosus]|uniref:Uncharacterized protein n=1 Tax=Araneus ventricosus TaxID=182803 RepID=A0A4Y2SQ92_ARAVE|nr:hypothetical protein AVEN_273303-1 [Araneus ventricosus]
MLVLSSPINTTTNHRVHVLIPTFWNQWLKYSFQESSLKSFKSLARYPLSETLCFYKIYIADIKSIFNQNTGAGNSVVVERTGNPIFCLEHRTMYYRQGRQPCPDGSSRVFSEAKLSLELEVPGLRFTEDLDIGVLCSLKSWEGQTSSPGGWELGGG